MLCYNRSIQMQTSTGAFNTYTRSNQCKDKLQMATSDFITIPLTKGYVTTISIEDSDLAQFKWCATVNDNNVYAQRRTSEGKVYLHKIIFLRVYAHEIPKNMRIDHIDVNSLNNIRTNLRLVTHAQNIRNKRLQKNNTTGYKGVSKRGNRYRANICVNRKNIYLGIFNTAKEAYDAYCNASVVYHGEYGRIR